MELEGTLDAFSLPDILMLLSSTRKTGALHVTRGDGRHGAVHLRDGAVIGARTQVDRQELGRRLVGSGLVDEQALDRAVERLAYEQDAGLGRVLADTASLDAATARELAGEQAVDAVFDLLRWTEGSFAFDPGERDPDDLGAALPVDQVVAEARARLDAWPSLTATVPSPGAVVVVAGRPPTRPEVSTDEWWLLALVDGHRTVADLVLLSGRGEHAVVRALAGLVERELLQVRNPDDAALTALHRQQALLAGTERAPAPAAQPEPPAPGAGAPAAAPAHAARRGTPGRAVRPAHTPAVHPPLVHPPTVHAAPAHAPAVPAPPAPHSGAPVPMTSSGAGASGLHGAVHGATALQPETLPVPPVPALAPQEGVDTTLLLRLIAGVRGL